MDAGRYALVLTVNKPDMNFKAIHTNRKIILVISVIGLINIFLPWQSFSVNLLGSGLSHGVNGFRGAGILAFLCLGAVLVLCLAGELAAPLEKNKWLGVLVAGIVAALCAVANMISTKTGSAGFIGMDIGIGCWITLLASAAITGAALLSRAPGQDFRQSLNSLKKGVSIIGAATAPGEQPAPGQVPDKIAELEKLVQLKEAGHLSEQEYLEMKKRLLAGS